MIIKLLNDDALLKASMITSSQSVIKIIVLSTCQRYSTCPIQTTVIQLLKRIEDYHVTILPLVEMLSFFTIDTNGNNVVNNKVLKIVS